MLSPRPVVLVMLTLAATACGGSRTEATTPAGDDETHSATREDCTAIVDANVEVQLRVAGLTDAAVLEERKKEMRDHLADDIQQCIGKNVSARMIRCVKGAKTLPDIDRCLRP